MFITLSKTGNLQQCQNYQTISPTSHQSKVILKPQAERIIAEEQAGFTAGRSTTEQIFNLYHVFIDMKKAFDRVWHAALWTTVRNYNISANLIRVIKRRCDKATSAVLFNGSI